MTDDHQTDDIQAIEAQMDTELDETAQLQAQLEESERERDQFKAMALRYKADLDNYKKRAAQEMEESRDRISAQLLLKLVTVADDFSRAVNHLPEDSVDPSWFEGIQLVLRSMEGVLHSEGLSRIEAAIGQPFDVYEHEAVFFEPTNEVEEGAVVRVIRDGYKLRNRVLRAAQVSVAQALPEPDENPESEIQQQEAH
jgi:molecular chaperone GrpE